MQCSQNANDMTGIHGAQLLSGINGIMLSFSSLLYEHTQRLLFSIANIVAKLHGLEHLVHAILCLIFTRD